MTRLRGGLAAVTFDEEFRLLPNIGVGGNCGQKGLDESIWPQRLGIDYVRVFQLKA